MGEVSDLWDLKAEPEILESLEATWKTQAEKLAWAAETVDRAANQVIGAEAWTGETAERYDTHRRKVVADLDDCAELAGRLARAVGECAQTLRTNQGLLTAEREKLSGIRSDYTTGELVFHPADEQEADQVEKAIGVAKEIRARVDRALHAHTAAFRAAAGDLQGWQRKWSARQLRMLNYNIQQGGGGNHFFDRGAGTDHGDMGQLAQRIVDGKIDVATLQEIFKTGSEELERELNRRAGPGEHWEVHFAKASEEVYWSNGGKPFFPGLGPAPKPWDHGEDFGNAVVVRTGNGVSISDESVHRLGEGDEGRSAAHLRVTVE